MKKFIACLTLSVFALAASLQAENTPAASAATKASPTAKDKAAATCDECDGKTVCKTKWTLTKPVLMSPKAAAAAGR